MISFYLLHYLGYLVTIGNFPRVNYQVHLTLILLFRLLYMVLLL